ncbi:Spb1 C-terminal domain-containing protein [Gamsiella multidivaricata]|uniref:Spb1 C-terminal domain-containing protein n=1 Tax=Gamsiella multidivaricata TaxID=101098 RepID=UPI002220543B|nr:Spb1 C-terminal domain-containing protein [Gamsiella multidivaricata]KAG0366244.1 AdoMet-dependent rRNA methyltransferase spb1 [Gamsiella multidivaricata]KAI7826182.1 Spb1 C-terminal domain-containing protein [Gamsiella multidivaricata]
MGKTQKKTGKGRLDKYYHMAKEQGYRARSAFKLVQLNKKYNFLERSKVLIDLCAAPGGWLQVASKMMPVSSLIVGVDLAAIKPLPNVITYVEDITTEKCRATLRTTLKTWKADVVLHDGAPNVGTAWVQDAFTQSELVLQSLKLATEFLNKGGWFVTKVFRSKDYNNLMWVFQQLFKKVEATKPPSSRNVSAEIFVVCRDYLAPKKIDPKFLDPKHVFSEVDTGMISQPMDVFHPEKHKRQREGYEDGNYTLHKTMDAWEFITHQEPVAALGSVNQFSFDSEDSRTKLVKSVETTEEIIACCADLKVLGKKDFKLLLRWRLSIRLQVGLDKKPEPKPATTQETVEVTALDDVEAVEEHAAAAAAEESRQDRVRRRQKNERVQKNVQRMQLGMIIPTDIGLEQDGPDGQSLFSLTNIEKAGGLKMVRKGDTDVDPEEFNAEMDMGEDIVTGEQDAKAISRRKGKSLVKEDIDAQFINDDDMDSDHEGDEELMEELDEMYEQYKERQLERDAKLRAKAKREDKGEWKGFKKNGSGEEDSDSEEDGLDATVPQNDDTSDSDTDSDSGADDEEGLPGAYNNTKKTIKKSSKNPLLVGLDDAEQAELRKKTESGLTKGAKMFFDQDMFKGLVGEDEEDEEDEDEDADDESNDDEEDDEEDEEEEAEEQDDVEMDSDEEIRQLSKNRKSLKRKAAEAAEGDADEDDIEMVPVSKEFEDDEMWDGESDEEDSRKRKQINEYSLITAEAMTLAQSLVNKKMTKTDLIDQGFTKQAFAEKDGLPAWFLEDEQHHNVPNLPITKEAVQVIKDRMKALDARPIKKIAEAKARKKYKAAQKLMKIQKKADAINETDDISEKQKSIGIAKLLAKAAGAKNKKPKKEVKLVVAKGSNKGNKGRPKGVKGRYKMVDSRMKKELRATKRITKKAKGSNRKK